MATISVQSIASAGLVPALAAVAASDEFVDDGKGNTFLEVANANGSSINVTIAVKNAGPYRLPGLGLVTLASIVVAVANGARKFIGPFSEAYIDQSTGRVQVSYSATSGVTAGAFKLAKED